MNKNMYITFASTNSVDAFGALVYCESAMPSVRSACML